MRNLIKTIIFSLLNLVFCRGLFVKNPAILMYHSIGDNEVFFTVRTEEFENQMEYLSRNSFNVVPLSALLDREKMQKRTVILTFDDGYLDNYENVFPVLKKYGFPATIFLAIGFMGSKMNNSYNKPLDMLKWDQIKEMHNSGIIDFEPHTRNHKNLADVALSEASSEIDLSRDDIENNLNKKCNFFCYPHGGYNDKIKEFLESRGFTGAVCTSEGIFKSGDDIFSIRRNSIDKTVNMTIFKGKLGYSNVVYQLLKNWLGKTALKSAVKQ